MFSETLLQISKELSKMCLVAMFEFKKDFILGKESIMINEPTNKLSLRERLKRR